MSTAAGKAVATRYDGLGRPEQTEEVCSTLMELIDRTPP